MTLPICNEEAQKLLEKSVVSGPKCPACGGREWILWTQAPIEVFLGYDLSIYIGLAFFPSSSEGASDIDFAVGPNPVEVTDGDEFVDECVTCGAAFSMPMEQEDDDE